jgi:hypothetical protein
VTGYLLADSTPIGLNFAHGHNILVMLDKIFDVGYSLESGLQNFINMIFTFSYSPLQMKSFIFINFKERLFMALRILIQKSQMAAKSQKMPITTHEIRK